MPLGYKNNRIRKKPINSINVTPFVDIILVLLIIFMITSPMLNNGYKVNLPKVASSKITVDKKDQIIISVDNQGIIRIGNAVFSNNKVIEYLTNYKPTTTQVFIKGDKTADYGTIIDLMSLIHSAGFNNISLVTDKLK